MQAPLATLPLHARLGEFREFKGAFDRRHQSGLLAGIRKAHSGQVFGGQMPSQNSTKSASCNGSAIVRQMGLNRSLSVILDGAWVFLAGGPGDE
jgi:hypothetical protein